MSFVALPDTITEDEALAGLSGWGFRFFINLLARVDAWGRFSANPEILRGAVWPLSGRGAAETLAALEECGKAGLLTVYRGTTGSWVQVEAWDETYRQVGSAPSRRPKSRYPIPDAARLVCGGSTSVSGGSTSGLQLSGAMRCDDGAVSDARAHEPPPEAPKAKRTRPPNDYEAAWNVAWEDVFSEPFVWSRTHATAIAELGGRPGVTPAEITRRTRKLLRSDDQWDAKNRTPRYLLDKWGRWAAEKEPEPAPPETSTTPVPISLNGLFGLPR